MAIKNVVKVMNFHSLLRVDKARRTAEKYRDTESDLLEIIKKILLNKNILLDKKTIIPNKNNPVLNIYIGNDLGFCGDFNFSINKEVRRDKEYKVLIGNKIHFYDDEKVLLRQSKDDFYKSNKKLNDIIYESVRANRFSEINIIYNHYYNINKLEFTKKKLYPVEYRKDDNITYDEDFGLETNIENMLEDLLSLYICFEIKICEMNSYAAENVVRQIITKESLKKIDEIEEERIKEERKIKKNKDFQKIIENFRRD